MAFDPLDLVEKYAQGFVSYLAGFFDPDDEEKAALNLQRDGRLVTYSFLSACAAVALYCLAVERRLPDNHVFWSTTVSLVLAWMFVVMIVHATAAAVGARLPSTRSAAAVLRVLPIAGFFAAVAGAAAFGVLNWLRPDKESAFAVSLLVMPPVYAVLIMGYLPPTLAEVEGVNRRRRWIVAGVAAAFVLLLGWAIGLGLGDLEATP